jgi:predicted alpha/beta-hydrolase family hydrolase
MDSQSSPWLVYFAAQPMARMLLTHGAGAPVQSEMLQRIATALSAVGIEVWARNFAYMEKARLGQRQPPPKVVKLQQELAAWCAEIPSDLPLLLAGKSMGGRVCTQLMAAAQAPFTQVKAVVVFGYPFRPPAKKQYALTDVALQDRTAHLLNLRCSCLILQGDRDAFGGPDCVTAELLADWPQLQLQWIAAADHDFKLLKQAKLTPVELAEQLAARTKDFINAAILAS